jgi:putrescine aminotransferase
MTMQRIEIDAVVSSYQKHSPLLLAEGAARTDVRALAHLVTTSARGATLRTADGREIIDFASGGFGYGHRYVVEQVSAQMRRMPLSSRMFFSRPLAMLAARLARITPGALEVSFFGASGSEAMEGALKLARGVHPKRRRIVVAKSAYHGGTMGALSACGVDALRSPLGELPLTAVPVPYGDAAALAAAVDEQTLAIVLEPIHTGTGVQLPPPGYLTTARACANATGALFIADEVATGLARTGRLFAVDAEGVAPDVMVLGSGLGAGLLPIGAYITTRELNNRVYDKQDPLLHANTTGGNPSACTAALAGLDLIEREDLTGKATANGIKILYALEQLAQRHEGCVERVEGRGHLAAIRLRDGELARALQSRALERGVLTRCTGMAAGEAWIAVRPPLLAEPAELEAGLDALAQAAAEVLPIGRIGTEAAQ